MRKIIQITGGSNITGGKADLVALCDDGSVFRYWENIWVPIISIHQDDVQEQQSDVIDVAMKEHKEGCEAYSSPIKKIMDDIEEDQGNLSEDSERYKDLQYLLEMVDLCWGVTDLCGSGHKARLKNLADSRKILNNKKVMV